MTPLLQYWPIFLTVFLGFAAIYLLLPRAQRFSSRLHTALHAVLALAAAGWFLIYTQDNVVETVLFYVFAGLAVAFGGLMLSQQNPVHAALSFAMVVLSTCGLFLLQAAPFLMAATIIIYAGAIVVTFLFVIMLAQQAGLSGADARSREPFLATVAGFVLLAALLCVLHKSYSGINSFVERADRAAKASTVAEWDEILGKDDAFFTDFAKAVLPSGRQVDATISTALDRKRLANALINATPTWHGLHAKDDDGKPRSAEPGAVKAFKEELQEIVKLAAVVQNSQGSMQASADVPQSRAAGRPASEPPFHGGKDRLPAANIAGLGKTLFTDYLLAVELAGTLLLVATIGAIAIAGRRAEGLR